MTLLDKKSHFNCEIYAWGFKRNMHNFSHIILSNLKGNSEEGDGKIIFETTRQNTTGKDHGKQRGKSIEHYCCSFWETSADPSIRFQDSLLSSC